jgi:hypothetical protein
LNNFILDLPGSAGDRDEAAKEVEPKEQTGALESIDLSTSTAPCFSLLA